MNQAKEVTEQLETVIDICLESLTKPFIWLSSSSKPFIHNLRNHANQTFLKVADQNSSKSSSLTNTEAQKHPRRSCKAAVSKGRVSNM